MRTCCSFRILPSTRPASMGPLTPSRPLGVRALREAPSPVRGHPPPHLASQLNPEASRTESDTTSCARAGFWGRGSAAGGPPCVLLSAALHGPPRRPAALPQHAVLESPSRKASTESTTHGAVSTLPHVGLPTSCEGRREYSQARGARWPRVCSQQQSRGPGGRPPRAGWALTRGPWTWGCSCSRNWHLHRAARGGARESYPAPPPTAHPAGRRHVETWDPHLATRAGR